MRMEEKHRPSSEDFRHLLFLQGATSPSAWASIVLIIGMQKIRYLPREVQRPCVLHVFKPCGCTFLVSNAVLMPVPRALLRSIKEEATCRTELEFN